MNRDEAVSKIKDCIFYGLFGGRGLGVYEEAFQVIESSIKEDKMEITKKEERVDVEFIVAISKVITSYYWRTVKDYLLGNSSDCFNFVELKALFDKFGYERTMNTLTEIANLKEKEDE